MSGKVARKFGFPLLSYRQRYLPALLLFLTTVAVFSPACFNGFIDAYDDELYLTLNSMVQRGVTLDGIRWAFTTLHAANWHPLAWLSHQLDVQLFGMVPFGHHVVSVLVHGFSALLVFSLLQRLGVEKWGAWCAAAVFALHPQRVESVAWLAERKDVLSVFFGLAALNLYVDHVRQGGRWRYPAVVLLYAFSLMSKPMLVTLPFIMLLMDALLFGRIKQGSWVVPLAEKIPLLLMATVVGILTLVAQRGDSAIVSVPLVSRIPVVLAAYLEYLRMFVFPYALSFHYPLATTVVGAGKIALAIVMLVTVTALLLRPCMGHRIALFGWLWFLVTLLPVSGVVRFGGQFVADRYTYFPHIGLLVALAWGIGRFIEVRPDRIRAVAACVVILLAMEGVVTVRQIGYWKDGETLYRRAIELNPGNWLAYSNLGSVMIKKDRYGEGFLFLARSQMLRGYPREALETLALARREGGAGTEIDLLEREIRERMR